MPRLSIRLASMTGFSRFSAISPICWPTSSIAVLPSIRRCAAGTGLL
jgi:hypothetical protein